MIRTGWLLMLLGLLGGCASFGVGGLQPGASDIAQVRAQLGEPGRVWPESDGSRWLEYSGQPSGAFCHMIHIGADGRVIEVRNAFGDENLGRVQAGLSQEAVSRLLGKPEEVVRFDLKPDEEVWSWLIETESDRDVYFVVTFGRDGHTLRSERLVIWRASGASLD